MTPESVMAFGQHAMYVAMLVSGPLLLTALAVGLLVGVIQAATQINEMTLSFIPKLLAMALVALIAGPWMLRLLVQFTRQLIETCRGDPVNALDLAQLQAWLGGLLWAMGRVGGLCLVVPVFSASMVPARIRIGLILVLTLVLAPLAPGAIDPLSGTGVVSMLGQVLIGAAIGFVLRMAFEAVTLGGELVSQSMSLGFASVADPQTGASSTVLSQFYLMLVTLLFVVMDGHLRLIALLADSFHSLPPDQLAINAKGLYAVAGFAAELFAGGVRVALPAMTSLLVVNIGFAAISRAAPSMNLFAVGFPITVSLGFIALWLSLRSLPGAFEALQDSAWTLMRDLVGG